MALLQELRDLKTKHMREIEQKRNEEDDKKFNRIVASLKSNISRGIYEIDEPISGYDQEGSYNKGEFSEYLMNRFKKEGLEVKKDSSLIEVGKGPDGWDKTCEWYRISFN